MRKPSFSMVSSLSTINSFTSQSRRYSIRFYSTNNSNTFIPDKFYSNADIDKNFIIKENRFKAGVYRWTNLISKKSYIGSSINLGSRLKDYYNYSFLTLPKNKNMIIYKALLKYGYSNFSLEIIEYCDESVVIEKEQYYFDLFKPEYNILKTAGNTSGFKYSPESLIKMSLAKKGKPLTKAHIDKIKTFYAINKDNITISRIFSSYSNEDLSRLKALAVTPPTKESITEFLNSSIAGSRKNLIYIYIVDSLMVEVSPPTLVKIFRSIKTAATKYILIMFLVEMLLHVM